MFKHLKKSLFYLIFYLHCFSSYRINRCFFSGTVSSSNYSMVFPYTSGWARRCFYKLKCSRYRCSRCLREGRSSNLHGSFCILLDLPCDVHDIFHVEFGGNYFGHRGFSEASDVCEQAGEE